MLLVLNTDPETEPLFEIPTGQFRGTDKDVFTSHFRYTRILL